MVLAVRASTERRELFVRYRERRRHIHHLCFAVIALSYKSEFPLFMVLIIEYSGVVGSR